jgi:hypothetical protein
MSEDNPDVPTWKGEPPPENAERWSGNPDPNPQPHPTPSKTDPPPDTRRGA